MSRCDWRPLRVPARLRLLGLLTAVTVGVPEVGSAETADKAAFRSLSVSMKGIWIGQHDLTIQGAGSYTFDVKEQRKDRPDYHAAYRLQPEHLRRLDDLLQATKGLTVPVAPPPPPSDATSYSLTLDRGGQQTTVVSDDVRESPYKELLRFLRQIDRQETLVYQATFPDRRAQVAYELENELGALAGKPLSMPYAPILDYHRLVPACREWLAKPQDLPYHLVGAAADLMAFLKVESSRADLEAIAQGHAPGDAAATVHDFASAAAVRALGALGGEPSLSTLESLQAHRDGSVQAALAEALLSVPPAKALPLLTTMTADADSWPAAWALIRLGAPAETAIVAILEGAPRGGAGPRNLIREYYEHWKELTLPPNATIVQAIRDRVQAEGGQDDYGCQVLQQAGQPFVAQNAWQGLDGILSVMATKGQERRKKLLLLREFGTNDKPPGFLEAAAAGTLEIRRVLADRTDALACVADSKGNGHYVLLLFRDGRVWSIACGWDVLPDKVPDRVHRFLKEHPEAKPLQAEDAPQ